MLLNNQSDMEYTSKIFAPTYIIEILKKYNLSLKNDLGQNFLINRDVALKLLKFSSLTDKDVILEIGSGLGTLTFLIAERVKYVISVEIDGGIYKYLKKVKNELGLNNIFLINSDFLKLKPSDLYLISYPNKVISNFPYSIATKSILKIFDEIKSVKRIIGTIQKELAERFTAKPSTKNYSYVSVYLQFISSINILEKNIRSKNFFPAPEVGSSIIDINKYDKSKEDKSKEIDCKLFKKLVKASFSNRRKYLVNNLLKSGLKIEKDKLREIILKLFNSENIRAEELSVEDYNKLYKNLKAKTLLTNF